MWPIFSSPELTRTCFPLSKVSVEKKARRCFEKTPRAHATFLCAISRTRPRSAWPANVLKRVTRVNFALKHTSLLQNLERGSHRLVRSGGSSFFSLLFFFDAFERNATIHFLYVSFFSKSVWKNPLRGSRFQNTPQRVSLFKKHCVEVCACSVSCAMRSIALDLFRTRMNFPHRTLLTGGRSSHTYTWQKVTENPHGIYNMLLILSSFFLWGVPSLCLNCLQKMIRNSPSRGRLWRRACSCSVSAATFPVLSAVSGTSPCSPPTPT